MNLVSPISWFVLTILLRSRLVAAEYKILSRDQLGFKFMNFFHKPDTALVNSSITVYSNVADISSCQLLCLDHKSCLSINVGKNSPNQTSLECELNNSTSLLKPLSVKKRKGFDFYGLAEPCFSNPCLSGGACIPNMADGTYRCCPIQIPGVPYLDHHCTIERSLLIKGGTFRNVFHLNIKGLRYPMNYYEAERACAVYGAQMSSLKQLEDAWRAGFDSCSYGWLIDGTVRYPIYNQPTRLGCGGTGPPSIRGNSNLKNKLTARYNSYCYRETDDCKDEDWHQNGNTCYKFFLTTARSNAAIAACALEGAVLGVSNSINKIGFIRDFLQRSNFTGNQIFVGLQQGADGAWKWIDGGAVQPSLWNVTQPTGPIGTVNTVMESLDSVPDSDQWKLPFVCQKQVP